MELSQIKGIGNKTELLLNKMNIHSAKNLLNYFPRTYEIYEKPILIKDIDNQAIIAVEGFVVRNIETKKLKNLSISTTYIKDLNGDLLKLTWFNMPYIRSTIQRGTRFVFRGHIKRNGEHIELEQPEIYTLAKYDEKLNQMQPVYSLIKGISNNLLIKSIKQIINVKELQGEYLDEISIKKYELCNLEYAYQNIHFPVDFDCLKVARKRLVFDEFFRFIYQMRRLKEKETFVENQFIISNFETSRSVIEHLPYELTNAQNKVINEIRNDISGERVMQRLIQGDVGSGKTIVAFATMLDFAVAGLQSVLMAPTEVLAEQHYMNLQTLIQEEKLPYTVALLTGSVTQREKKKIYQDINNGDVHIIIGTHAVFQEKVIYNKLALVITDEQHRFGVMQRATLKEKGLNPHVLVMSATPIPRTLAIILYGDLDISIIDELPNNRLPIKNCVVTADYRNKAYKFIKDEVEKGRQAYVICPMVEENDMLEAENVVDYSEKLKQVLPKEINICFLHGKMTSKEKNSIMRKFENNEIQILVSTTVIEVGINVPNATVMMVENAERFGLASLHQLRGRVGRGKDQSYCIFVSSSKNKDKLKRLDVLNKSNDGFFIASEDLKLRGPGDFFGIRQSGEMQFELADIYTDGEIMKAASEEVDTFLNQGKVLVDKQINDDIVIY